MWKPAFDIACWRIEHLVTSKEVCEKISEELGRGSGDGVTGTGWIWRFASAVVPPAAAAATISVDTRFGNACSFTVSCSENPANCFSLYCFAPLLHFSSFSTFHFVDYYNVQSFFHYSRLSYQLSTIDLFNPVIVILWIRISHSIRVSQHAQIAYRNDELNFRSNQTCVNDTWLENRFEK